MALKVKKILISQPEPTTGRSPYYDVAEKYHVEIFFRPFIRVDGLDAKEFKLQKINILNYTAVVFTARIAVDHFFALCEEMKIVIPESMKYFCSSEAIALYLQKYTIYRKRKIFFSSTGKMDGLAIALGKHSKDTYLVPVSDVHNGDVTSVLDSKKTSYTKAIMYRTVSNEVSAEEIAKYDMLIFFSPIGIKSLLENAPNFKQGDISIGAFGQATCQAVIEAGLRLDCEAPLPGMPSMTAAVDEYVKKNHKEKK